MTEAGLMTPLRLLLLEDNPADSRLLVEGLREQIEGGDISIKVVSRVADALQALCASSFDCALADLGLPDSDGVSHVARLREQAPQMVIIVLTGRADEHAAQEAFRLGAQDYLIKGDQQGDELLEFVRKAVSAFSASNTLSSQV